MFASFPPCFFRGRRLPTLVFFEICWHRFPNIFRHRFWDTFSGAIFPILDGKLHPKGSQKCFQSAGPQTTGHLSEPIFDPRLLFAPFGFHLASFFASFYHLPASIWHRFLHHFNQNYFYTASVQAQQENIWNVPLGGGTCTRAPDPSSAERN